MTSTPLRLRPLLLSCALVFTACGGGDDESDPTNDRDPLVTLDTSDGDTDDTDFTFPELPEAEFEEYSDGQIRFANFWRQGDEGSPVDLYWGYSAETGEKIDTLEYGTVSDWYTMKIETNGLTVDDETRLRVLIQMPGDETSEGILQTLDPTLDGEHRWTVVMGWTDTFNPDRPDGMSTQLVYEEEIGEAPAGQALLLLNDIGIRGLEGGDFISLDEVGTCNQEWSSSNDIAIGNGGTAYPVPSGSVEFLAHDANISNCAQAHPTDPISLDLAEGDRYLVLAWGTSIDDRTLEALPIES